MSYSNALEWDVKMEFREYQLQVQNMYNEYLKHSENRNISYGEIAWIESLKEKELNELEFELEQILYGGVKQWIKLD